MVQRHRSIGSLTAAAVGDEDQKWTNCTQSAFVASGNVHNGCALGEKRTMDDVVIPGFISKSKRGEVFFNPMTSSRETVTSNGGSGYYIRLSTAVACPGSPPTRQNEYKRDGDEFQFQVLSGFGSIVNHLYPHSAGIISGNTLSRLVSEASTHARSQVGRSNANLFEDWAEREKSLSILHDLTHQVNSVLNKTPLGKMKAAGNAYLMYRYGIKPLISDIYAVVKAIAVKEERRRASSRGSASISESSTQTRQVISGVLTYTIMQEIHDTISVRAVSLDEYVTSKIYEAGISSKGFITLPWELIPYSFVADWFANIGDFIGSLVPTPYFSNLGSCVSVTREIVTNYSCMGTSCPGGTYTILRPLTGSMSGSLRTYARSPGLPNPSLIIRSNFGFSNITRVADAFALIAQRIIR